MQDKENFDEAVNRIEPGLYMIGQPYLHAPIWLVGNSYTEITTVYKQVGHETAILGVLDTGGVSLWQAVVEGGWSLQDVAQALDRLDAQRLSSRYAILPHAIWTCLGESDLLDNFYLSYFLLD